MDEEWVGAEDYVPIAHNVVEMRGAQFVSLCEGIYILVEAIASEKPKSMVVDEAWDWIEGVREIYGER